MAAPAQARSQDKTEPMDAIRTNVPLAGERTTLRTASRTRQGDLQRADTAIGSSETETSVTTRTTRTRPAHSEIQPEDQVLRGPGKVLPPVPFQSSGQIDPALKQQYLELAPPELRAQLRTLSNNYRQTQDDLVRIENRLKREKEPVRAWQFIARFKSWKEDRTVNAEVRKLRSMLTEIRAGEKRVFDQVHKRAREQASQDNVPATVTPGPGVPALLMRASVPRELQGRLPGFRALSRALDDTFNKNTAARHSIAVKTGQTISKVLDIKKSDDAVVLTRQTMDGKFESMMFRYREDGKVSYYTRRAGESEWKREAVMWNDNALKVGTDFLGREKPFPKVIKREKHLHATRILAPVELAPD